ncbi:hypothetical protein FCM35_KLT19225 [Carex littledalei]|uniref:Uncharacterized protein n=1 Tax=Carex littledalei TaxID=544730 RepID=A0A833R7L8_9POAL|nr:hypothetical protein FCM35_KLT19225 [Carex littledalei]
MSARSVRILVPRPDLPRLSQVPTTNEMLDMWKKKKFKNFGTNGITCIFKSVSENRLTSKMDQALLGLEKARKEMMNSKWRG